MRQVDQRGTPPANTPPLPPGAAPNAPHPVLSWLALGATLLIVVLLARTLTAYPLVPLRLPLGGAPAAPTLVTTQQDSGVPGLTLQNVVMASKTDGWATGWRSTLDGTGAIQTILLHWDGSIWTPQATPDNNNITALAALPNGQLWLAEGDTIFQFLGGTWHTSYVEQLSPSYLPSYTIFTSLDMISPFEGWAAGDVSNSTNQVGVILHYHDGGWTPEGVDLPAGAVSSALRSLSMTPGGQEGWAVGSLYTYSDEVPYALHYASGVWTEADDGLPGAITSVATVDEGNAWIVGITSDAGPGYIEHWQHNAWLRVASPTTNQLHAIAMLGPDEGYIAGDGAATLHYVDGAWQREGLVIHGTLLSGISMTETGEGWAVGGGVMLHEHNSIWSVYTLSL